MRYQLPNGQLIGEYQAFTYNDIQYPENWIALASAEERQKLGIQEFVEQPRPDDRFYFVTDNGDGTYSTTPKQLDDAYEDQEIDGEQVSKLHSRGLKYQQIMQVKETAGKLLAPTDWMVLRQLLKGIGMSAHVENYRNAVVDASNQFEQQIAACNTVEELAALQFAWPDQKDF